MTAPLILKLESFVHLNVFILWAISSLFWSVTSFLIHSFNDFLVFMFNNPLSYFRQGKNSYIWLITTPKGLFFSFLSESENFWTFCEDTSEESKGHSSFIIQHHLESSRFYTLSGLFACCSANNLITLDLFSYFCPILYTLLSFPIYKYIFAK